VALREFASPEWATRGFVLAYGHAKGLLTAFVTPESNLLSSLPPYLPAAALVRIQAAERSEGAAYVPVVFVRPPGSTEPPEITMRLGLRRSVLGWGVDYRLTDREFARCGRHAREWGEYRGSPIVRDP
jgi:hypothetical protein